MLQNSVPLVSQSEAARAAIDCRAVEFDIRLATVFRRLERMIRLKRNGSSMNALRYDEPRVARAQRSGASPVRPWGRICAKDDWQALKHPGNASAGESARKRRRRCVRSEVWMGQGICG